MMLNCKRKKSSIKQSSVSLLSSCIQHASLGFPSLLHHPTDYPYQFAAEMPFQSCPRHQLRAKTMLNRHCHHHLLNYRFCIFIFIPLLLIIFCAPLIVESETILNTHHYVHCKDLFRNVARNLPCLCSTDDLRENGTHVNCDHVSFFGDFPTLPFRSNIISFTQRFAGVQNLEPQLFTSSALRLKKVDFSHNTIRRLRERMLDGIEESLVELNFSHNFLGDQLNPIFSTNELYSLSNLKLLDLSFNQLKALDSNIFKGVQNLTELYLNGNEFTAIQYQAILPLRNLRTIGLASNQITEIPRHAFPVSLHSLVKLNLSDNRIVSVKNGAFVQLKDLSDLNLSHNKIKELKSNSLEGLRNLQILDLSGNFLDRVPIESLIPLRRLRKLLLGSNAIQTIEENGLNDMPNLEHLDLSRNFLISLGGPNFFNGLVGLRFLNLAYNSLRKLDTIEDNIFAALTKLEVLDLSDNQLDSLPASILNPLTSLRKLFLDYNKMTTLSDEILSMLTTIDELSFAYNLFKEVPNGLAKRGGNLRLINMHGNRIEYTNQEQFEPIAEFILGLDLGFNDLTEIPHLIMPKLMILNLAMNQFTSIGSDAHVFADLPSIRHLNLSANMIHFLPPDMFAFNPLLEVIDLRSNIIERVDKGVFRNNSFTSIILSGNRIKELSASAFQDLPRLGLVDVSDNEITSIKHGAFNDLPSLKVVKLRNNKLTSFKGDFFTQQTRLEEVDLCDNQISYLYPNSFVIHRRLRTLRLCNNKLSYFSTEILSNIRGLELIDLSHNRLHSLDSSDFANMPSLKSLNLRNNELAFVGSNAFANSTLLYQVDLSHNQIRSLDTITFRGLARLSLDLSHNHLDSLPDEIFSRSFVFVLESIDLSVNNLTQFPSEPLRRQYSSLERVYLSHNLISALPPNSDLLVNLKHLDLSFNPLSPEAQRVLFQEPKSVRHLNVASTGIILLPDALETPFIRYLNVSHNNISSLKAKTMESANMLVVLDMSHNKLTNLNSNVDGIWKQSKQLRELYVGHNPIQRLMKGDLSELVNLQVLDLSYLPMLTQFDCDTLANLHNLKALYLYGYPSLNYLAIQECLSQLNTKLERLGIEIKENALNGHLQRIFSSRTQQVIITGKKLKSLSSSSLMGIRSPSLEIKLVKTSVNKLPSNLFSPLPMSTKVDFVLLDNEMGDFNYQLLDTLDSKQMNVRLMGLQKNPIICDCNLEPLWRWTNERLKYNLNSKYYTSIDSMDNLTCSGPDHLRGYRLLELNPEDLICSGIHSASSPSVASVPSLSSLPRASSTVTPVINKRVNHNHHETRKPDIILPSRKSVNHRNLIKARSNERRATLTKVDTMIIGIAAGVIAFVCILILIICIIRLRSSSSPLPYPSGRMDGPIAIRPATGGCTCLKPYHNSCGACYTGPPQAKGMFASPAGPIRSMQYYNTLRPVPIKMLANSSLARLQPLNNKPSAYYVAYPEVDSDVPK